MADNGINKEIIKSLNQLLQGEYMAVESFNNFISRLEDEKVEQSYTTTPIESIDHHGQHLIHSG